MKGELRAFFIPELSWLFFEEEKEQKKKALQFGKEMKFHSKEALLWFSLQIKK